MKAGKIALQSRYMEIKRLITKCAYRIEPKPGGGFVARTTDPAVPPLEAPTREELQQKIQENIRTALTSEFPGLKLPEGKTEKFAFHLELKPGGGVTVHSADGNTSPIETSSHAEMEKHLAEMLLAFAGDSIPELGKALAAQGNSGDVQVLVQRNVNFTLNRSLHPSTTLGNSVTSQLNSGQADLPVTAGTNFSGTGDISGNSPITPEAGNSWKVFRFLLTLLIVAAIMYFYLHHR